MPRHDQLVLPQHKVVLAPALLGQGQRVAGTPQVEVLDALAVGHASIGKHPHGHPHERGIAAGWAEVFGVVSAEAKAGMALEDELFHLAHDEAIHVEHTKPDLSIVLKAVRDIISLLFS